MILLLLELGRLDEAVAVRQTRANGATADCFVGQLVRLNPREMSDELEGRSGGVSLARPKRRPMAPLPGPIRLHNLSGLAASRRRRRRRIVRVFFPSK